MHRVEVILSSIYSLDYVLAAITLVWRLTRIQGLLRCCVFLKEAPQSELSNKSSLNGWSNQTLLLLLHTITDVCLCLWSQKNNNKTVFFILIGFFSRWCYSLFYTWGSTSLCREWPHPPLIDLLLLWLAILCWEVYCLGPNQLSKQEHWAVIWFEIIVLYVF